MDEDSFKADFNSKSVFRQLSTLDLSYVPNKLLCRDESIRSLIFQFRKILEEKDQPSINCLMLGKGGVGKTVTAKYFGKRFKQQAEEKNINLFVEIYNCINFRSKSKIIRDLLSKYTHSSGRGFSDDEGIKQILSKLIRDKGYILLIIDEVHLLKTEEILAFLDIAETFGHQNAKFSILLISRENDWIKIENERILSRLNEKIKLNPYDFEEALKILKYRSDLAFYESIDEEILNLIAEIVVEHKNMRHGIEILRKSGLYVDKEGLDIITPDIIREASNNIYPTFRGDIIDKLKDQELISLLSIVKILLSEGEPFTSVDNAYEEYCILCENYEIEAHVKMSFRKYVRQLNELKILKTRTVRVEEAQRGRRLEITLLDIPASKLGELIETILGKKFS
ncbi:MAG: Cdc6/Cdc18 family protein [Promethearchaeota archaeon]